MLFCTHIWRHPVLLVHANIADKDIRYTSTSKTINQSKQLLKCEQAKLRNN
jgi:hypothetical protein